MIIYIHGFGGSGLGVKSSLFREYFKKEGIDFISPTLSYIPDLAIQTLEELIESYQKLGQEVSLIGSSLGGYYSIYLSQKYNIKAVLLNPSIYPMKTLSHYMGNAPSFYDESFFSWIEEHIEMLKSFWVEQVTHENFFLLVQTGDELLDYKIAVEKFQDSQMVVEEGGDHSFVGIEDHFVTIVDFIDNN